MYKREIVTHVVRELGGSESKTEIVVEIELSCGGDNSKRIAKAYGALHDARRQLAKTECDIKVQIYPRLKRQGVPKTTRTSSG